MVLAVIVMLFSCSKDDVNPDEQWMFIEVRGLTITEFPQWRLVSSTPLGDVYFGWDFGQGRADIYPYVAQGGYEVYNGKDQYIENANYNNTYFFPVDFVLIPGQNVDISVRDYDFDNNVDDLLGKVSFMPYNGLDKPIQLSGSGNGVSVLLDVTYTYFDMN